jgi:predicted sugar kinase
VLKMKSIFRTAAALLVVVQVVFGQTAVAAPSQNPFVQQMKQKEEDFATRLSNLKDHVSLARKSERPRLMQILTGVQTDHDKFAASLDRINNGAPVDAVKPELTAQSEKVDSEIKQLERHFKH